MSVRGVNIEVGDKLRYLGGDPTNMGELLRGRVYEVVDIDYDVIAIDTADNGSWAIGDAYKNVDCFEKVEEEGNDRSAIDLIANLAQEVTELKRELSELRDANQAQAHKFYNKLDMILDDIVMLDERTQGANNGGQKLLSKEVYIYDTE